MAPDFFQRIGMSFAPMDRKSTRLNSSHITISYAVFCLKKKNAYNEAKRVYDLDKQLYDQKVIGSQEFQSAKNNYEYQEKRKKLAERTMEEDSISTKHQL